MSLYKIAEARYAEIEKEAFLGALVSLARGFVGMGAGRAAAGAVEDAGAAALKSKAYTAGKTLGIGSMVNSGIGDTSKAINKQKFSGFGQQPI